MTKSEQDFIFFFFKQSQHVWGADVLTTISPPLPYTFKDKRSFLLEKEVSSASSSGPV